MRTLSVLAGFAAAIAAVPAAAQDANQAAGADSALEGDRITIGVGGIYSPSYRGSDDYVVSPVPLVQGQIGGIGINPRAGGIALDFIPDDRDSGIGFSLGPVVTYSANRSRQIKDDVVRSAGKLDEAIELGVNAGITGYKLLNPYDSLTLSADVRWDVAGAHKGMVVSPNLSYATPVSRGALVALNVSARHVDDDFASYYYSVSPRQNLLSGLPRYSAEGGWDSVTAGLLAGVDLDGDLVNGGFAIFGIAAYSKLLNDAKDTPYTSIRGDSDQWVGGLGLAYTF